MEFGLCGGEDTFPCHRIVRLTTMAPGLDGVDTLTDTFMNTLSDTP